MSQPKKSRGPRSSGSKWAEVWEYMLTNSEPVDDEDKAEGWLEYKCGSKKEAKCLQASLHQRSRRVQDRGWRVQTQIEDAKNQIVYFRRVWIQTPDQRED